MSINFKKIAASALVSCGLAAAAFAEAAPATLTVEAAVDAALRNNLGVKSAVIQERIKKRASEFSFNKFYPTLSGTATINKANDPSPVTVPYSTSPMATPYGTMYDHVLQVTPDPVTDVLGYTIQEVFSPVYVGMMYQSAIDWQASKISRAKAEKQMSAAVRKFFYQLIVQKEAIALTQARLDNANERLRQARISYELGQGNELNYMYAKANVEGIIPDLRSMETSRVLALTKFQEMLGFDKNEDMQLAGSLDDEKTVSPDDLAIKGARFDVNESDITVKQLKSAVGLQGLVFLPNLILQYSDGAMLNGPTGDTLFKKDSWTQSSSAGVSLTLSWNVTGLIPGSDTQVKMAELNDQLALAKESAEQTARNAMHDEENQKRQIADSIAKIDNLKNVVDATHRSYELTDASYKAGVGRYLDLQSAELSWQGAQIQLLNEKLNLLSLVFDFEAKYNTGK
jgi:outer membrane protein TolC